MGGAEVSVRAALRRVVAAVEAREDDLVDTMIRRNAAEVPGLGLARDEPTVLAAYRASARANLRAGLAMLSESVAGNTLAMPASNPGYAPVAPPGEAVREARESARARVPLEALLHTYRIGHAVAWEALIEEVDRCVPDPPDRRTLLQVLNRYTFAYVDAVLPVVSREYQAEHERAFRQAGQRRLDAVLAVLGGAVDVTELNYEISGWHHGLIAWGSGADTAVSAIADRWERPALCVRVGESTAWGWIGGRRSLGPAWWQGINGRDLPPGVAVAVGGAVAGPEGFRRTHQQARDAQHIGMALGNRLTAFSDIAVEALALRDPDAARAFVDDLLAPLRRARHPDKLRDTLEAYLRCGLNATSAAASLGIGDRTVAYRLRAIEQLTRCSLESRRFELEAAVRLERVIRSMPTMPAAFPDRGDDPAGRPYPPP